MTDLTPERIAQLRKILRTNPNNDILYAGAVFAALDEIERLSVSQERYRQEALTSHAANDDLRTELSRVAAERDSLIEQVKAMTGSWNELSRVKTERDEAVRLTQRLYEDFAPPPSPGCSCHISPPCNDCVEHSYTRELLEEARAFLSRMEGRKDG